MNELYQRNKNFFNLYAVWGLISITALIIWNKAELFFFINGNRSAWADVFYAPATHLGDGLFFIALIVFLLFIKYRYALMGVAAYALSSAVTQSLKRIVFHEPRPAKFFEGIQEVQTVNGTELYMMNSFPSGHATTVFAIACLCSLIVTNKRWQPVFLVLAIFSALSRLYLGQHFFADITLGGFIGTCSATVCVYWLSKPQKNWMEDCLLSKLSNKKLE
jgi:membrane-associated phospholipid phosphatase